MTTVVVATRRWSAVPDFAGHMWVPIQYVLGLRRLGIEAYWIDHIDRIDPLKHPHSIEYLDRRMQQSADTIGFGRAWSIIYGPGKRHFGLSREETHAIAERADLLLGLSTKALPKGSPALRIARRAYLDLDPGFTQIWAHQTPMGFEQYEHFFTIGQNVRSEEFDVPLQGIDWQPMRPPVVLEQWPFCFDEKTRRFSTVGDWWGKQYTRYQDQYFGSKREEFLRFAELPLRARQRFELALTLYPGDHHEIGLLARNGWHLLDPYLYAGDLESYREFIQHSRAEWSVAKNGYVRSRSGWISDRTTVYLASGKPCVVQSTGFEPHLPTGKGLLTFRTLDEAVEAVEEVDRNYAEHAAAARELAEQHFDSDAVLSSLLERAGVPLPGSGPGPGTVSRPSTRRCPDQHLRKPT